MKPGQPPTLSEYLLYEASKFLLYPRRSRERRTKTTVKDRELFDKSLGEGVEGRRTFGPYLGDKISNDPISLDDIYCRERLRAVSEMVRVTLKLAALPSPEFNTNSDSEGSCDKPEWWIYLRESANCLILGLPQASVALARAAVESCLRAACVRAGLVEDTVRGLDIHDMLNDPDIRKVLPEDWVTRKRANDVRVEARNVLHRDSPIEAEKALEVYEAARSVILSVTGG